MALVVGIDAYQHLPKLGNAANDARAMGEQLDAIGWKTTLRVNVNRRDMRRAIADFGRELQAGAIGLFFYAGHGMQSMGRNFLLPADAELDDEGDLADEAVELNSVLKVMEDARNPMNVVILDACRDSPLQGRTRSTTRGLAQVATTASAFVAFAAAPGQTAADGSGGRNGIFTGELVPLLKQPGLKIEDVFKRVTDSVIRRTNNRQRPWTQSSLSKDFYLNPPPRPVGGGDASALDLAYWESIKNEKDIALFEGYLEQFPNGVFVRLARARIEALRAEQRAPLILRGTPPQVAVLPPVAPVPPPPAPPPPEAAQTPAIAIEPIGQRYVATQPVNLRERPTEQSARLGMLGTGEKVTVVGRARGTNWLQVERDGRILGFVVERPMAPESTAADQAAAQPVVAPPPAQFAPAPLAAAPQPPPAGPPPTAAAFAVPPSPASPPLTSAFVPAPAATTFLTEAASRARALIEEQGRSEADRRSRFRSLLLEAVFDVGPMARFVLGPTASKFAQPDVADFTRAFSDYMVNAYWANLRQSFGWQMEVTAAKRFDGSAMVPVTDWGQVALDQQVQIETSVTARNGNKTSVSWYLIRRDDGWRIVDVNTAGVSLMRLHRDDIASQLRQSENNLPTVTRALRDKVRNLGRI